MTGEHGHGSATCRAVVVANAAARGGATLLAAEVSGHLEDGGLTAVVLRPGSAEEVLPALREVGPGADAVVVAVGGDGTVSAVAHALAALAGVDRPVLAIAPGGTGNSLYRALWTDRDWRSVLDDILAGQTRVRLLDLLDVTTAGVTRGATLGASVGLVAEIVARSLGLDGVDGRDRYTTAAFEAIAEHRPFDARVAVDGAVLASGPQSLIAIGGARHRSGTFELLPRSVLDDGLADVCAIHGLDGDGFVALAGPITSGAHLGEPGVAYGQGREITVERLDGRPLLLETDGDLWDGAGPSCTVSIRPNAVAAFAPIEPVAG